MSRTCTRVKDKRAIESSRIDINFFYFIILFAFIRVHDCCDDCMRGCSIFKRFFGRRRHDTYPLITNETATNPTTIGHHRALTNTTSSLTPTPRKEQPCSASSTHHHRSAFYPLPLPHFPPSFATVNTIS
jgi:hypothetical protein